MNLKTTIYGPEFINENGNTDIAKYSVCFNEDKQTFSANATYYNGGGQCLDRLMKMYKEQNIAVPSKIKLLTELWEKYHLNDLHAGTPEQEDYLHSIGITAFANNYEKCCEELKKVNLYECEWKGKKSYFGGSWFHWDIPAEDIEKIKMIISQSE